MTPLAELSLPMGLHCLGHAQCSRWVSPRSMVCCFATCAGWNVSAKSRSWMPAHTAFCANAAEALLYVDGWQDAPQRLMNENNGWYSMICDRHAVALCALGTFFVHIDHCFNQLKPRCVVSVVKPILQSRQCVRTRRL